MALQPHKSSLVVAFLQHLCLSAYRRQVHQIKTWKDLILKKKKNNSMNLDEIACSQVDFCIHCIEVCEGHGQNSFDFVQMLKYNKKVK